MSTTDHSKDYKRAAKNSVFLYMRMIVMLVVTLYTSRVIFEVLGVIDFGIYNVVAGVVAFLSFVTVSLANSTQRYLNFGLSKADSVLTRKYFNQSFELFVIFALLVLVLGETLGTWFVTTKLNIPAGREHAAFWAYQFALFTAIAAIMQTPYMSVIVARERMNVYAFIGLFEAFSKLACAMALMFVSDIDHLILYSALFFGCTLMNAAIYAVYCYRFDETHLRPVWDSKLVRELGSFIGMNIFGSFAYIISTQGINILLNLFFGPAVNAARGVASQVTSTFLRFTDSIFTAVKPQITTSYAGDDMEYMHTLIIKASSYALIFVMVLAAPVLFNIDFVLVLWLKNPPALAPLFTILVVIESFMWVIQIPLSIAANATGNLRRCQLYGRLFGVAALPLSYVLLKIWPDPVLPFIVMIFATGSYAFYCLFDIHVQTGLKYGEYLRHVILPVCIVMIPTYGALTAEVFVMDSGFLRFLLIGLTDLVIALPLTYCFALGSAERKFVLARLPFHKA